MIDLLPTMPKEVIESPWGIYDAEAKKVFLGGKAAMLIDYQHIWYEARDPALSALGDDPVEVTIIPGKGGSLPESGSQDVGECFGIAKTSPYKEAALDLIKHYSNAATQLGLLTKRTEIHTFDPADESGFPSYMSPYTDPSIPEGDKTIVEATFKQQEFKGNRYGTRAGYQRSQTSSKRQSPHRSMARTRRQNTRRPRPKSTPISRKARLLIPITVWRRGCSMS